MKTFVYLAAALSAVGVSLAQDDTDPGPSPTESYGCEPHGDHWHCEGARDTSVAVVLEDDPQEDDDHSASLDDDEDELPPSPTAFANCVPHGDHWDCEESAPATEEASEAMTPAASEDDDDTAAGPVVVEADEVEDDDADDDNDDDDDDDDADAAVEDDDDAGSTITATATVEPTADAEAETFDGAAANLSPAMSLAAVAFVGMAGFGLFL